MKFCLDYSDGEKRNFLRFIAMAIQLLMECQILVLTQTLL